MNALTQMNVMLQLKWREIAMNLIVGLQYLVVGNPVASKEEL